MGQTLKFLGRGSYYNAEEPSNSAYYKNNKNILLIDCGKGVFNKIKQLNLLDNVNNVFILITHIHKDHVNDLSQFLNYCKQKNIMPNIIKCESVDKNILYHQPKFKTLPYGEFVCYDLKLVENKDYVFIPLNNKELNEFVAVKSFVVPHMDYLTCCAFEITAKNKKIFYSGDCNKLTFDLKNYDEYYFECSLYDPLNVHLSMQEIEDILLQNDIFKEKVKLMHVADTKAIKIFNDNGFSVAKLESADNIKELGDIS